MRILLTAGEPAGIGPDVVVMACQQHWPGALVCPGDANLLEQRARQLGLPLHLLPFDPANPPNCHQPGQLYLHQIELPEPVIAGQLNPANSTWVLQTLAWAGQACLDGQFDAVATAPVHKGIINDAGHAFTGHTEFFADQAGAQKVVMMLATPNLRVALATTHLPLRQVADAISAPLLQQVIGILVADLQQKFGIERPRILVAGLNPHAGEQGHLGREELDIIEPTLAQLSATAPADLIGPLPADTLFTPQWLEQADAVLAMYHDQGLPVLKSQGFGEAVNITLGLPYVRTSVDHGTALDLAGSGDASATSMQAAIAMAFELAGKSHGSA